MAIKDSLCNQCKFLKETHVPRKDGGFAKKQKFICEKNLQIYKYITTVECDFFEEK